MEEKIEVTMDQPEEIYELEPENRDFYGEGYADGESHGKLVGVLGVAALAAVGAGAYKVYKFLKSRKQKTTEEESPSPEVVEGEVVDEPQE